MAEQYVSGEEYSRIASSRPAKQGNGSKIGALIAAAVILGAICFYGGIQYEKGHVKASSTTSARQLFGSGGFARRGGGIGQVTSVSSSSITINNTRSGTSQTFSINGSTTITDNGQTVTPSSIQSGDTVLIRTSGSGSTTATSILVNPSFGGGFGGGSSNGSNTTSNGSSTTGSNTISN